MSTHPRVRESRSALVKAYKALPWPLIIAVYLLGSGLAALIVRSSEHLGPARMEQTVTILLWLGSVLFVAFPCLLAVGIKFWPAAPRLKTETRSRLSD